MHFLFGEDEVCVNTGANHTPCTCINHKAILISFTRHSDTYSCKKINCPPLKFMTDNQNLSGTLMNTFNQQLFAQDNKYEALVCLCLFLLLCVISQLRYWEVFISNMLCLCHYGLALLGFWFHTDFGSENSASFFKSTGGEDLFLPWSRVDHTPCPTFMLWLVKIWQVSSCIKFMQHLESCLLWQLKLTEFWVNLWCF